MQALTIIAHELLPFLCQPVEMLHLDGSVTRTCCVCGRTRTIPPRKKESR